VPISKFKPNINLCTRVLNSKEDYGRDTLISVLSPYKRKGKIIKINTKKYHKALKMAEDSLVELFKLGKIDYITLKNASNKLREGVIFKNIRKPCKKEYSYSEQINNYYKEWYIHRKDRLYNAYESFYHRDFNTCSKDGITFNAILKNFLIENKIIFNEDELDNDLNNYYKQYKNIPSEDKLDLRFNRLLENIKMEFTKNLTYKQIVYRIRRHKIHIKSMYKLERLLYHLGYLKRDDIRVKKKVSCSTKNQNYKDKHKDEIKEYNKKYYQSHKLSIKSIVKYDGIKVDKVISISPRLRARTFSRIPTYDYRVVPS
jgi:hypothetical protein